MLHLMDMYTTWWSYLFVFTYMLSNGPIFVFLTFWWCDFIYSFRNVFVTWAFSSLSVALTHLWCLFTLLH